MRNYVINEAQSRSSSASFANLVQLVRNWRCRRNFAKLHLLGDHQLKDIGLTREELARISSLRRQGSGVVRPGQIIGVGLEGRAAQQGLLDVRAVAPDLRDIPGRHRHRRAAARGDRQRPGERVPDPV